MGGIAASFVENGVLNGKLFFYDGVLRRIIFHFREGSAVFERA